MKNETNPKIGVALSGGGVRGLAHLGVLQVLEEAQVPIDAIAGTSMGGIIAGLYAAGVPVQDIIAVGQETGFMDLASPDRGWRGLFGHAKVATLLTELLGAKEINFEDLHIPAAVVAADVETGELVILDKGPLIPALMATSAVPLVFSPVRHQGRWLVDGCVLNNLPVDVVRRMGADRVLGVNVPPDVDLSLGDGKEEKKVPLWELFRLNNHIRDWKLPFLVAETSAAFTVRIVNQTRLTLCPPDLLLEIHLPNVGIFPDDDSADMVEAGRRVATNYLTELVELKTKLLPPRWWRRLRSILFRLRSAWAWLRESEYPLYPSESSLVSVRSLRP
jgi:NTE family protein